MRDEKRRGFTLIELLVVIAVIALLMAVIIPALGKAKIYAQKVVCRSNLRQQCMGILLYSDQNDGEVPINTRWGNQGPWWFWDASFWMTDRITEYASLVPDVFFCPSSRKNPDDARWWQFSMVPNSTSELSYLDESGMTISSKCANYRVLPYIFLIDLVQMDTSSATYGQSLRTAVVNDPNFEWIRKLTNLPNTGSREMVMDSVISGGGGYPTQAFDDIHGGAWADFGLADNTCHLLRQTYGPGNACPQQTTIQNGYQPDGANIGFADGHVDWRHFEDMRLQVNQDTDFYW